MRFAFNCIPQQCTHMMTRIIRQRCDRFGRYPSQKQAKCRIDAEIDCNIHGIAHACAVKAVIKEYVQGLKHQHLPYDQGKALFPQKLCKFIAKQSVTAKATMYADDHKACTKRIECNYINKAWQQNGWK